MKKVVSQVLLVIMMFTVFLVLIPASNATGEPPEFQWSQTYGAGLDDRAYSVVQIGDGGYAIAGTTNGQPQDHGCEGWLIRTDSNGDLIWEANYGPGWVRQMIQTYDGGYALVGVTSNYDLWFIKTNATGDIEWEKTFGGSGYDQGYAVIQIDDEGYAIAGFTSSYGVGNRDFWLIKTDSLGNEVWSKTYGGSGDDIGLTIVQTNDGGYAIAGYTMSFGTGTDFWLVVTNSTGQMLWNKTYGETGEEIALSMIGDDRYAMVGTTTPSSVEGRDLWLVIADTNGTVIATQTYGGSSEEGCQHGNPLISTIDGGYAIAGYTKSFGTGSYDFWVIKTDAIGNPLWNQTYGGLEADAASSIIQTGDGGYAVAGYTTSFGAGQRDFWLIKLGSPIIQAMVNIDPNSLNLRSTGLWITAYIELPESYDVNDINIPTVILNNTVSVDPDAPYAIGDCDEDGVPDLMVKFSRSEIKDFVISVLETPGKFTSVILTVSGELDDGTVFEGSDTIRIICASARGAGRHTSFK